MTNKRINVLQPDFFKNFKCNGTICEDSCCIEKWNILLEKKNYKMLKNIKQPEFKKTVDKYVKRNRNSNEESSYGKIVHNNVTETCPFLNSNKLCDLQINFGEDYLCNVCKLYPRIPKSINGELERTLTVSCPIAAKMILMRENGFAFENVEEEMENIIEVTDEFNFNNILYKNKPEKYFWDIRILSIQIIKSRDYEIWERLLILGLFLQEIIKCEKENTIDNIPKVIKEFTNKIVSGIFKGAFDNIKTSPEFKIRLLKEIMDEKYYTNINSVRHIECCNEMIIGLKMVISPLEEVKKTYINSYEVNYKNYMQKKEYILENYIVNSIFSNCFPFGNKMSMWDNYILIATKFSIINMIMIGSMEYHKEKYTDEHTIKIIQSFSKVYDHNEKFQSYMIDLINKNSYNTMAHIAMLIKS